MEEMGRKTALLIDAAEDLREQIPRVLSPTEWAIREAPDNAAALELVKSYGFDVIVTGQETSAKEDIELLRSIRRLHPHTRVIILTDESTPTDVLEAIREGAFSYFARPFFLPELTEAIRNALQTPSWDDGIEIVSAAPNWVRLIARCDLETGERLLRFVHEMIDLPDEEKAVVGWALRELLMNSIKYGGNFDPQQYVELSYLRTERAVVCKIKDPGEGFSLDEIRHAAVSNPMSDPFRHLDYREAERLRPGLGIFVARNLVDELVYNEQGNEVLLIKHID
jgi:CheY-like chemotaxis protein/anti-sigma regulatory factor (Ser/Thr protein kinase)